MADDWKNSADPAATFPPATVPTNDLNDLQEWSQEDPPGWRKIEAAIVGGSAIETQAGTDYAATLVSPQSLADAGAAFYQAVQTLQWLETFINLQSHAIAGEDKSWQGEAADAFTAKMDYFANFIGRQMDRLNGGVGLGDSATLPNQLTYNANYLDWAQKEITHLDEAWATYLNSLNDSSIGHTKAGNVAISSTQYARPMTDQMLQVAQDLAGQYDLTVPKVLPPNGDGSPPVTTPTMPTTPTTTPITTPADVTITTPAPVTFTTPPPSDVTTPPPGNGTPPPSNFTTPPPGSDITTPPVNNIKQPSVSSPPNDSSVPPPTDNNAVNPPVVSSPPSGLPGFDSSTVTTPPVGNNNANGNGNGNGVNPPTVDNAPGDLNSLGGSNIPGVSTPPGDSNSLGGSNPNGVNPPTVSNPPGDNASLNPATMPGMPGSPGSGMGGSNSPTADRPDANGLLGNDPSDWTPTGHDVNLPDAPTGANTGGTGLNGLPTAGMPGTPGSPGSGLGNSGVPDRPDAAGLVDGDPSTWDPGTTGVDLPEAPSGAAAGGAGLGNVPLSGMPGTPGSPGTGAGQSGVPDRPDAAGLVTGDPNAWNPGTSGVDLPDAPSGTLAGGAGLEGTGPESAGLEGAQATGVPLSGMPGTPGSPGAGKGASGTPDRPDAAGLVTGDPNAWDPGTTGVELPDAPGGAVAGGAGLDGTPVADGTSLDGLPAAGVPGTPGSAGVGVGGSGIPDRPEAAGLVDGDPMAWDSGTSEAELPDAPDGAAAGGTGFDNPSPGISLVASPLVPPDIPEKEEARRRVPVVPLPGGELEEEVVGSPGFGFVGGAAGEAERESVPRPEAAELLREDGPTWSGGTVAEDRVPVVRPVEDGDTSEWDDGGSAWWLRGDEPEQPEREERVSGGRRD